MQISFAATASLLLLTSRFVCSTSVSFIDTPVTQRSARRLVSTLCSKNGSHVAISSPQPLKVKDGQVFTLTVQAQLVSGDGKLLIQLNNLILTSLRRRISFQARSTPYNLISFSGRSSLRLRSSRPVDREKDGGLVKVGISIFVPGCGLPVGVVYHIFVIDVNDNTPQFQKIDLKSGYVAFVKQDATVGTVIRPISVSDGDATSPNNDVKLSTLPPYNKVFGFKGADFILKSAPLLRQHYSVEIAAVDFGTPRLSNKTRIKVYVKPAVRKTDTFCDDLSAYVYDRMNSNTSRVFTSTGNFLEISNITTGNVNVSKGLWVFYSAPGFQGKTVVATERNSDSVDIETRSLRGFCIGKPLLAVFSQKNFTGKMTVFSATTTKLSVKAKSAIALVNSWAISAIDFRGPRLLRCQHGRFSSYGSLPVENGIAHVRAVKKLTEDGADRISRMYG